MNFPLWPLNTATAHLFRCEGRTGYAMGQAVLASECQDCVRRSLDRTVPGIHFISPPKSGPCMARLLDDFDEEIYV